jgi:hypothetical protein
MSEPALARNPCELTFPEFAEAYLNITPKVGGVVPFVLNEAQLKLESVIQEQRAKGKPVRIIILKARQMGMSTFSIGRMYEYTTTQPGVMSFLAAHDDDSTKDLFERARLMYDWAPAKPMLRYSNKTELDFSNPKREDETNRGLQSKIRIGTAGKTRLGRSKTLRYLHLSEVAFWDNAKRVLLGLEQALPDDADTIEIIESTANGVGGEFYDRWKRCEDPKTAGDWVGVFFPWHEFPEYSRPLDGGVECPIPACVVDQQAFLEEERELTVRFSLTPEQVNWRRWAIVNKCGNSIEHFRQEYPSTPEEAFLTSGRPIFNREKLMYRLRALQAEDLRRSVSTSTKGPRVVSGKVRRDAGKVKFVADPNGPLAVYRFPEKGREYCIGGDPCKGASDEASDPDFAEAHVYDRHTWEQVAVFRDRIEATEFSKVLEMLGYLYGKALIVPEANDHGYTLCVRLEESMYPNLYIRQEMDVLGNLPKKKTGWENNRKTRPILIDAVDGAITENLAKFNDIETIRQCLTFVRNPKSGKAEHDKGCHDDAVMASGLALVVMQVGPQPMAEKSKLNWDRMQPEQAMVSKEIEKQKRAYRVARSARYGQLRQGSPLMARR